MKKISKLGNGEYMLYTDFISVFFESIKKGEHGEILLMVGSRVVGVVIPYYSQEFNSLFPLDSEQDAT